ncbi:hypothetical protein [Candidatus Formimonas warabiya]|uniref:hypothetical protein n=1 Tax=Formimonas warabiya TaxID=1761012 RepID=UPI001BE4E152|nr:hypothetical protein [Candidatus Formimonas warabiya]
MEMKFTKLGHFWFDSGLVGLIKMVEQVGSSDIAVRLNDQEYVLTGKAEDVQSVLEKAYDLLTEKFYNLSSQKQKEEKTSYNFFYDSRTDCFKSFPKRKSVGIAEVIYNKAARPTGSMVKWEKKEKRNVNFAGKVVRRTRGILPDEFRHLQARLDDFLDSNGLDVTTAGLLVDGPNAVKPNVKIKVDDQNSKGICYLCGEESGILDEANQTVFPLITGSSGVLSFNSAAGKPEKVCWKCALLGKFVPATGFYLSAGEHLFAFLPYSLSLEKMCTVYDALQAAKYDDPSLYRNFQHPLGGYYQHPFEVTVAFLYTLYGKILLQEKADAAHEDTYFAELDLDKFFDITLAKAPLEFVVVHTKDEGSTFAGKMVWPFKETVYFFKLVREIEVRTNTSIKEIFAYLVDYSQSKNENKTLTRNRVCERILKKQTILDLVEKHVFHADLTYFKPLLDMLLIYELLIKEENAMFKDEQETAVTLGRNVGMAVGKSSGGKKGDLFALRKSRRKVDFLEQLNRLQFKLGNDFIVPADVYTGKLTDENFQEFKQFCMVAALNSYNYAKNGPNKEKKKEDNK